MKEIYEILKFRLGSESYDYEFEIIPIPPYEYIENNLSLEPYEYFGETVNLFDLKVNQVILYYNADVLMKVIFKIKGRHLFYLKNMIERTGYKLSYDMILKIYYDEQAKYSIMEYYTKKLL